VLAGLDERLGAVYSTRGRPSIPPEFLLRASLVQLLYSVRSERQLVEQIDFNLLFRWFVGLKIDERVWDHSSFTRNRERLFDEGMGRAFFERVVALAEWQNLASDEHFSVDGTLIQAWASHKSFQPRDPHRREPPSGEGRNAEANFHGKRRSNKTHASLTDPDAQLYRCAPRRAKRRRVVPGRRRRGRVAGVAKGRETRSQRRQHAKRIRHAVKPFAKGVAKPEQLRGSELVAKPLPERGVPGRQRLSPRSESVRRQEPPYGFTSDTRHSCVGADALCETCTRRWRLRALSAVRIPARNDVEP
jgi:transposase